jgi:hypothetical protein
MKLQITFALCISLASSSVVAQLGRHGGGERANVSNRSTNNVNRSNTANVNRGANVNNNANVNRNYNNNTNVNRNVNVNQNVNVNRNVNVNTNYHGGGCYNCGGYYHDNDWNWGSFAAGAAVAATTTAVVAAATRPSTTVVVAPPAVGTMVTALPGGCTAIDTGGGAMYNCSNVYYRPYYQGTALVYQVVTYP